MTGALTKALVDAGRVVDVSGLRLSSDSAAQVFPSALEAAGGWPTARLVLIGADATLADTLLVTAGQLPLTVDLPGPVPGRL